MRSDGDPLYMSLEFNDFVKSYDIAHEISSTGYAQSNGFIERHAATMKNMLYKCDDIYLALLNFITHQLLLTCYVRQKYYLIKNYALGYLQLPICL